MIDTTATICAISTPPGIGGIAVIRVSGKDAISIVDHIFKRHNSQSLSLQPANTIVYGSIVQDDGQILDQVVLSLFRAPHSFTGEDTVEISCHGSVFIQQEIIRLLINHGCRLAQAGEFTQRAFVNGKLDLTQAEAIADLIASQSSMAHRIALNQMRGNVSDALQQLHDQLLHFTSLIELELDFADHEELEFADRTELNALINTIQQHIRQLISTFSQGNAIKNGIPIAIIGPTNAGKSTLLNMLVGEEKAIVSSIHGTTRDTIEDTIYLNGIAYRFIDTAGIRTTTDEIEHIGISRSISAAQKATIVLIVIDSTLSVDDNLRAISELISQTNATNIIIVLNKSDLITPEQQKDILNRLSDYEHVLISAKQGIGKEQLTALIEAHNGLQATDQQSVIISNLRHYEALQQAAQALQRVEQGLHDQASGEILSLDLNDCLNALSEITGEITSQDVLNSIFSHFCIGK